MSESAAVSGLPVATAEVHEHSASVTAFGETRQCSAVSRELVETEVMDLLMSVAYQAGGEIHVVMTGEEPGEFILTTSGDTRPVGEQPPSTPIALDPNANAVALWTAPQSHVLGAAVVEPLVSSEPSFSVDEPALAREVDPYAVEPATWGARGWMNRLFRVTLSPTSAERAHRARQSEHARVDADSRARLLQEATRTLGYCGYLTVMSEKGGIGKTTISSLLAWFIAEVRQQSVVVADLNPDKGSLAPRIGVRPDQSIRDLVRSAEEVLSYEKHVNQFLAKVPHANVSVLAGDTDPKRRETTSAKDVETLAQVFRPFFQVGILDNGTGITHSALQGSLNVSHGAVIVVDNTEGIDDFVNSTLDHLEANDYAELRGRVVLVVIESTLAPPVPQVDRRDRETWERAMRQHEQVSAAHVTGEQIASKFRHKVRDVVIFPYDPALAGGGTSQIRFENLTDATQRAARQLAGSLIDDLVS